MLDNKSLSSRDVSHYSKQRKLFVPNNDKIFQPKEKL